jgi:2-polyprenyl-3-methyl-5-hydroxy-6-metoxy-1,4-benzoquinol methylase
MKIIIGPTCAGKSTLINQMTTADPHLEVQYGFQVFEANTDNAKILHYNLLHYHTDHEKPLDEINFKSEPVFRKIFSNKSVIDEVIVLVAPITELMKRAKDRAIIEKEIPNTYDKKFWMNAIKNTNLYYLYYLLDDFLHKHSIKAKYLFSVTRNLFSFTKDKPQFIEIDPVYVWKALNGIVVKSPQKTKVQSLLNSKEFHYQELNLPYGLKTKRGGYNHLLGGRSNSYALFTDELLKSKSVLDVGSALGEISFYAEKLGCVQIDGIEYNKKRFNASMRAKKLLASDVKFYNADFLKFPLKKSYDVVICLNVIHHINDFHAFLHKLCKATHRFLILEFPTLLDPKYLNAKKISFSDEINKLPLVGVSSILEADQYFVFSPEAIISILENANSQLKLIRSVPSPIPARQVMVFQKL